MVRMAEIPDQEYAFTGAADVRATPTDGVIEGFSAQEVLLHKDRFLRSVQLTYEQEKQQSPLTREMNLADADDLERAYFHTKVHAITGLLEWGTSSTYSIPYWDIQALAFGLRHVHGPAVARERLEHNYQESVRALLGYITIAGDLYVTARSSLRNLDAFSSLGKVTRSDLTDNLNQAREEWEHISTRLHDVLFAKCKHALFLMDQIHTESARHHALASLEQLLPRLGIDTKDLIIDIGIDSGLMADSYRPPYEISVYRQLHYLGQSTYDVPRDVCPIFTYQQLQISIGRLGSTKSELVDPATDIPLPWRFEGPSYDGA